MFSVLTVQFFGVLVASLAAALLVLPSVRKVAINRGWVDLPDGCRKVHRNPVAVVGGIGIVVGSSVGLIFLESIANTLPTGSILPPLPVVLGALLMFGTGLYDDVKGLDFKRKFVLQIAAAYLLILSGAHIDLAGFGLGIEDGSVLEANLTMPITLLWIVGLINAINLVDGLDGLASGLSLIAFSSLALVFAVSGNLVAVAFAIPFIGGVTAFLFHNFNPARIFMGDSGSYFLGFSLAAYSLLAPTHADPVVGAMILVVILGIPLLDTLYAMLRRAVKGDSPFVPDRDHIHHRLMRCFSHKVSVLILYGIGACLGLSGVSMALLSRGSALTIFAAAVGLCLLFTVVVGHISATVGQEDVPSLHAAPEKSPDVSPVPSRPPQKKVVERQWGEAQEPAPVPNP